MALVNAVFIFTRSLTLNMRRLLSFIASVNLLLLLLMDSTTAQYVTLQDTSVISSSSYNDGDGVFYSVVDIPKSDSILIFSNAEIWNNTLIGNKYFVHSIEMLFHEGKFVVPHECISVHFGDETLQLMFPRTEYNMARELLSKIDKVTTVCKCKSIQIADYYFVRMYYHESLIVEFEIKNEAPLPKEFYNLLNFVTSFSLQIQSDNTKGISTPIMINIF